MANVTGSGPTRIERAATAAGALFAACLAAGIFFADIIASPAFYDVWPEGVDSFARVEAYLLANRGELRSLSFFPSLAALALLVFGAAPESRSRGQHLPSHRLLAWTALAGSIVAATMLLLSATAFWTITEPALGGDASLARALLLLAYVAGGLALVSPLALTIAATSLLARWEQVLPAWMAVAGLASAGIALLALVTLLGTRTLARAHRPSDAARRHLDLRHQRDARRPPQAPALMDGEVNPVGSEHYPGSLIAATQR